MAKGGRRPGAGAKPKPTAIKLLEGNPGKRKLNMKEPKAETGIPTCPDWLTKDAKTEWRRLAKTLHQMGVLATVDRAVFAKYCEGWARWKEAEIHITEEGAVIVNDKGVQIMNPWVNTSDKAQKQMMQAATELGLTPSSRSRIIAAGEAKANPKDEMEEILSKGAM